MCHEKMEDERGARARLTWILGVFRAHIFIARVQDVLVHESRPRRYLSEKANLDRLTDLDPFTLLYKDLSGVLAPIAAV